jgi:hypothetical protein
MCERIEKCLIAELTVFITQIVTTVSLHNKKSPHECGLFYEGL